MGLGATLLGRKRDKQWCSHFQAESRIPGHAPTPTEAGISALVHPTQDASCSHRHTCEPRRPRSKSLDSCAKKVFRGSWKSRALAVSLGVKVLVQGTVET